MSQVGRQKVDFLNFPANIRTNVVCEYKSRGYLRSYGFRGDFASLGETMTQIKINKNSKNSNHF